MEVGCLEIKTIKTIKKHLALVHRKDKDKGKHGQTDGGEVDSRVRDYKREQVGHSASCAEFC